MKKYLFLVAALIAGALLLANCTDDYDDETYQKDTIVFDLTISGTVTKADSPGEDTYNENKITSVDIFLFDENAGEEDAAALHEQASLSASQASVSFARLKGALEYGAKSYKVIAIANCSEVSSLGTPTLKQLKGITVTNRTFRSGSKQESFVMTSFDSPLVVTLSNEVDLVNGGTVKLRRVAAKIRMAINVPESIEVSENDIWYSDLKNMRLYISNGVKTARLDGKISTAEDGTVLDLGEDDYFSILTQGGSNNDDYNFARQFTTSTSEKDDVKPDYPYYNALPYYTYPNEWRDGVTESHQTTLTIVIPWKDKEKDETTYKPTYYVVPLNNDNQIVSNAYYYLRANINMMGGETPAKPMPVDMKCEMANWGTADDTDVNLRPLRFLIFNQDHFEIFNETSITIPFSSTHPIKDVDFKGKFYQFVDKSNRYGDALSRYFDKTTKWNGSGSIFGEKRFYYYTIDNVNNTITFTHNFFDIWNIPVTENTDGGDGIKIDNINGPYEKPNRTGNASRPTTRHKLFSQVDIELTVQHDSGQSLDEAYEETIYLTFYPAIYITTEYIQEEGGPLSSTGRKGWILVNGYGYEDDDGRYGTGYCGVVSNVAVGRGETKCLTTFTVTNLDKDDADMWTIGDPRTYYINNNLSNASMENDVIDQTLPWTENGGPYNGSQTNRHYTNTKNIGKVIWEYYTGDDWRMNWSQGVWDAKNDFWSSENKRTLSYYYPTSESDEKSHFIAPKFTAVSFHARRASVTREQARKRCAAYQQYGYPAGRWRLPTTAEVEIMRDVQNSSVTLDIYGSTPFWCANGSTDGAVNTEGHITVTKSESSNTSHWTRCIYDNWYWEQVDADGNEGFNRIPDITGDKDTWHIFTWGDRPKENPQTRSGEGKYTVEKFLEQHKGIRPVEKKK